ncbi:MAG: DUF1460 domain-containing protein [Myxococcota bacterium]|nr:DUF1460 domain-containing protein [Myxococcota bacterium]
MHLWLWLWLGLMGEGLWAQDEMFESKPIEGGTTDEFDIGRIPDAVASVVEGTVNRPLGQRIRAISEAFKGLPYLVDAAGEGQAPDLDPPARYDAFDCLTFVEEVLALSLSPGARSAPMVRDGLRYGTVDRDYASRNHFMTHEWIPRAIGNGWLEDVSTSVGQTHLVARSLSRSVWLNWSRRSLFDLPDDRFPVGRFVLPVLSLDSAMDGLGRIPEGSVLFTVRKLRSWVPITVTHVGIVVGSDGGLVMRHASLRGKKVVRDDPLSTYLEYLRSYSKWEVDGVALLAPREQGPRRAMLDVFR